MTDDVRPVAPAMAPVTVGEALKLIKSSRLDIAGLSGDHAPAGGETEFLELQRVRALFQGVTVKHAILLMHQIFSDDTSPFTIVLPNGKALVDADATYAADLLTFLGDFVGRTRALFGAEAMTHQLGRHLTAAE